jgi:hypothetical protein
MTKTLTMVIGIVIATAMPSSQIKVARLKENPLITTRTSKSLGTNVNGPTVIRVPDWVKNPLGRYYMYFANHMGEFIRLAYADAITGPWKIYEPGVLHVRDTAMFRPGPDPKETLEDFYTHVASTGNPDRSRPQAVRDVVSRLVDRRRELARSIPSVARAWAQKKGYSQFTQSATSVDGLQFQAEPCDHEDTIHSGVSARRLLLRCLTTRTPVAIERSAREFRARSQSIPRRPACGPDPPCRAREARQRATRVLHGDRRYARARDAEHDRSRRRLDGVESHGAG